MKKRFLSLALALVMLFSLAPVSRAAEPTKLPTPTGLEWKYNSMNSVTGRRDFWYAYFDYGWCYSENDYLLKVYKKTETEDILLKTLQVNYQEITPLNGKGKAFFADLTENVIEDGDTIYFTVTLLGDGVNTLDSDPAVSPEKTFHFAPTPSNPRWSDGNEELPYEYSDGRKGTRKLYNWDMVWDNCYDSNGRYIMNVYRKGQDTDEAFTSLGKQISVTNISPKLYDHYFRGEISTLFDGESKEFISGQYYYILRTKGDEDKEILNSKGVKSSLKTHVQPEAKLETPTNLRWENTTACCDDVDGKDKFDFNFQWSAAENFSDPLMCGGLAPTKPNCIPDHVFNNHGEGYYRFRVHAVTSDPEVIANSDLSDWSPVYKTTGAEVTNDLKGIVDNLPENPTKADINNAIQQVTELDRDTLKAAMLTDHEDKNANGQLKTLEEKSGVIVDAKAKEGVSLDTSKVSLVGAALNAAEDAEKVTFTVSKPEQEAVIPGAYKNTVQFDFKLDGGKAPEGQLDVPIKITMPVPDGISPSQLHILHYYADGRLSEIVFPYTYQENGVWFASFVVDHFSTFAFAEASAATIGDKSYDTLAEAVEAAKSGDTIVLQKDYDGEKITVSGKSLTINCGKFSLDASKIEAGNNVTKKVTGTSGVDQIITLTYSAGSTGGGSTGGGGGGGSIGGGSVAPKPEDKRPEETVKKASEIFVDVEAGSWYEEAVTFAVEKGLFKGVDETHFAPAMTTTRAMIMTVLARLDGHKADTYDEAVKWAVDSGVSDGSDINAVITREQFVTMLYRYAEQPEASGELTGFTDMTEVSDWAWVAMSWAVDNGIIKGNEQSELSSKAAATRAEAAAIMQRYITLIEK